MALAGCLVATACSREGDSAAAAPNAAAPNAAVPDAAVPDATVPASADAGEPAPAPTTPPPPSTVAQRPGPSDAELRALRDAYDADRANAEARQRLAIGLFDAGRTDEALELFETAAKEDPSVRNLMNLGRAYTRSSRYPEAEAVYRRVLQVSPDQPVALHNLGNLAMRRGNAAQAGAYYQQATQAKPDYILAWFHLAEALREQAQYQQAYQTFGHVLELRPTNAQEAEVYQDALYEMASLDIIMGAHQRAADMLAELVRANPEHVKAHYAYGQALLHLGRVDEAQQQFELHMAILARQKTSGIAAMGD